MESDEQTPRKKPRIDIEEDIINLKRKFKFEFDSLKTLIEEELDSVKPTERNFANQMVITQQLVVVNPTTTNSNRNP